MRKPEFPYESLLRFRHNRRDLCRQLLAQVLAERQRLQRRQQALLARRLQQLSELRELGSSGNVDVDRSASRRYYAGQILVEIDLLDRNRRAVDEQLALCRAALTRADQEVKVLEKLREKRLAERAYEQNRREARERDETWHAVRLSQAAN